METTRLTAVGGTGRRLALDAVPMAALVASIDGRVTDANHAWRCLTGLSTEDSRDHGWLRCLEPDERVGIVEEIRSAMPDGPTVIDRCITDADGTQRWTRWWLQAQADGNDALVVVAIADIDGQHPRPGDLQHRATHDSLTGLINRQQFYEHLGHALRRSRRHHASLAVLFIDLDHFKTVNDTLGHRAGDVALVAIANALRQALRPEDVLARVGGDEFAVMCDDLDDPAIVTLIGARLRAAAATPIRVGDTAWRFSASVGIAIPKTTDEGPEDLLDRADRDVYRAKAVQSPSSRATPYAPRRELGEDTAS